MTISLLWTAFMAIAGVADRPTVALLPCEPTGDATARTCDWLDGKLRRELSRRAELVPVAATREAVSKEAAAGSGCDDACLARAGKRLGADRIIDQGLFMQDKDQSTGIVWIWTVHQVDVAAGRAFGHFERMCMCPESVWDFVARQHAARLLEFDPARRLELPGLPKAAPSPGPSPRPDMVYVPAGEFVMGSELGEFDEEPRHVVNVADFYIDKYETTNAEYQRCVDAGRCRRQTAVRFEEMMGPTQPVVGVGWYDAVAYCGFAGKRLPTEAEWEKAARGTDERRYPWGNEWRPDFVNTHRADDGFPTTAPVGSFPGNVSPYGAYDMAGNAWEWVWDFHDRHYYEVSERDNPRGPASGERHVMRGGSWMYDVPFFMAAFNRSPGRPYIRKRYVGFRCAVSLTPRPSSTPGRGE